MLSPQKKLNSSRIKAQFTSKLEKNLAAYMAVGAASWALAAATPAAAKIVYTPGKIAVSGGTTLDLNNDGIADFAFGFDFGDHVEALVIHPEVSGNGILCYQSPHLRPTTLGCHSAEVGKLGTPVGFGYGFATNTVTSNSFSGGGVFMAVAAAYGTEESLAGPWAYAKNRYLGLRFLIKGKVHYGWARMSVGNWNKGGAIVINGYAYETVAGKTIHEGHTSGPFKVTNFHPKKMLPHSGPATLSALARGSEGLVAWRREEELAA